MCRVVDTLASLVTILAPMRFPLPLTAKIAAYVIGHKLRGTKKFATVLQLEPLHTCNLTCTGCGRIREYSTSLKDMMSLEDCLAAANRLSIRISRRWWTDCSRNDGSFIFAPTPCSCAKRCVSGWPRRCRFGP